MERYSSQLLYKNIGNRGQKKLKKSSVCIVGIGALGTVCAELLARAGIGKIMLIDRDIVEISNLQRQTLFYEEDIGKQKAATAKGKISKINSETYISSHSENLNHKNILSLIGKPDAIIGCTDNLESRFLINDYARKYRIPWIFGAVAADKGFIFNVLPKGPCFSCIYGRRSYLTCDIMGVINSASGVVGSIMAKEAIKILIGKPPEKSLLSVDIWNNEITKIKANKRKSCKTCKRGYVFLEGKEGIKIKKLCGDTFQVTGSASAGLHNELAKQGAKKFRGGISFKGITVFEEGRAIIQAKDEKEARNKHSRYIGN